MKTDEVLPRFELGSLDSESRVLTITPQGRCGKRVINFGLKRALAFEAGFEPNPSVFSFFLEKLTLECVICQIWHRHRYLVFYRLA